MIWDCAIPGKKTVSVNFFFPQIVSICLCLARHAEIGIIENVFFFWLGTRFIINSIEFSVPLHATILHIQTPIHVVYTDACTSLMDCTNQIQSSDVYVYEGALCWYW